MKRALSFIAGLVILAGLWFPVPCSLAESGDVGENVMSSLSDTQRNSIGVLNYLSYLTKEIESRKDSRMYLEEAYSSLYNNTYMNAIDAVTLGQVKSLLTALNNFKMLSVKRERLEYIHEQEQAQAIREAVPDPSAVMSLVLSDTWPKAIVSIINIALDSAAAYYAEKSEVDFAYLQEGWELEDEEAEILHQGHLETLEYMWEIIHDYNLPGDLAINEDDITRFVDWKNNGNLIARIQFLEANRSVYQAFGEYWLTLAESYYENGDMEKCLEAVGSYETYSTRIFRKDYHYAKVLVRAIHAAREVYDEERYAAEASRFASRIIANCDQEDWTLRFFAAETYLELAERTADEAYLRTAYDITVNNVNYLSRRQAEANRAYLAEIIPVAVPAGATAGRKKEIDAYNKGQTEARKTALPPVSEALVLNCDLLFSLADQIGADEAERQKIKGILYGNGDVLFLNPFLNSLYSDAAAPEQADIEVSFDGKEIRIPARFLTDSTEISVGGLDSSGKVFTIGGWTVKSVERKKNANVETFTAVLTSSDATRFSYTEGSTVWINFNACGNAHTPDMQLLFSVTAKKDLFITHLTFQRIE